MRQCVEVCCSVLQCVAVCCSVLQCVEGGCSVAQCVAVRVSVCCSVLQHPVPVADLTHEFNVYVSNLCWFFAKMKVRLQDGSVGM